MANTASIHNPADGGEPKIVLLWRHTVAEATALARQEASRRLVFVRLVNQAIDQALRAASEHRGIEFVTLPMAFAGRNEGDQVLRHAVLRQL